MNGRGIIYDVRHPTWLECPYADSVKDQEANSFKETYKKDMTVGNFYTPSNEMVENAWFLKESNRVHKNINAKYVNMMYKGVVIEYPILTKHLSNSQRRDLAKVVKILIDRDKKK